MALAAVALGSNLPGRAGSREANLDGAIEAMGALGTVVARSRWIETDPVGYVGQPAFLNGAALLHTTHLPEDLLQRLLSIEQDFGRDRSHAIAKGPRTLDLDLLFYDDVVLHRPELVLPHPAMAERRFVLEPLADIAPEWLHPVWKKTVREMLVGVS